MVKPFHEWTDEEIEKARQTKLEAARESAHTTSVWDALFASDEPTPAESAAAKKLFAVMESNEASKTLDALFTAVPDVALSRGAIRAEDAEHILKVLEQADHDRIKREELARLEAAAEYAQAHPKLEREAPAAGPVPATAAAASSTHQTKRRAEPLAAVLAEAKRRALDSADWQSVWAALVVLAQSSTRPAPLLGYVEGEGVKYQTDDARQPDGYLSREAFRKRFKRKG